MGNCCKPASSSMQWDGEDWSFMTSANSKKRSSSKVFDEAHGDGSHGLCLGEVQKEKLMGAIRASNSDTKGIVKIKISKKELAELLQNQQKVNRKQVGRASAEQVLLRLINARNHDTTRHRIWRPMLESIPEVN